MSIIDANLQIGFYSRSLYNVDYLVTSFRKNI